MKFKNSKKEKVYFSSLLMNFERYLFKTENLSKQDLSFIYLLLFVIIRRVNGEKIDYKYLKILETISPREYRDFILPYSNFIKDRQKYIYSTKFKPEEKVVVSMLLTSLKKEIKILLSNKNYPVYNDFSLGEYFYAFLFIKQLLTHDYHDEFLFDFMKEKAFKIDEIYKHEKLRNLSYLEIELLKLENKELYN